MFRCVSLVDQQAATREQSRQFRILRLRAKPEDDDKVEAGSALFRRSRRPCKSFLAGFAAEGDSGSRVGAALRCKFQTLLGDVSKGDVPTAVREPDCVAAGAPGKIERASGRQRRAGLDEEWVGVRGLRFAR